YLVSIAVAVADALHKASFFIGQGGDALALHFLQQLVHTAFFVDACFFLALESLSSAFLLPAPPPARATRLRWSTRRQVTFQTRVTLREIVAEQGIFAAGFQDSPMVQTNGEDETSQT